MQDFKKPDSGHLYRSFLLRKSNKLLDFKYPKNVNENNDDIVSHYYGQKKFFLKRF